MVSGLSPLVGNDLVAWSAPVNAGKSRDERFVSRVFSPPEQRLITLSNVADVVLWTLWAAKEAAFKIAVKQDSRTVFSPVRFEVSMETSQRSGKFRWPAGSGTWSAVIETNWLHVWAVNRTDYDLGSVATAVGEVDDESAGVRRLALKLLSGLGPGPILIEGRPPVVMWKGSPARGDLSLSHDEGYGAVAWLPG